MTPMIDTAPAQPSPGRAAAMPVPRRFARGVWAGGFATFVALFSHVGAGGAAPPLLGVLIPLFLSLAVCTVLAGLQRSLLRLSISVGVSQLLFHGIFTAAASALATALTAGGVRDAGTDVRTAGNGGETAAGAGLGGHGHHALHAPLPPGFYDGVGPEPVLAHAGHLSGVMFWAHVAAAVVTIAVFYRKEHGAEAIRRLLTAAGSRLCALISRGLPAPDIAHSPRHSPGAPVRELRPLGVPQRANLTRGPPAAAF